ncbi:MAG: hypothetical protein KDD22_02465 [Bdellovibrionales bacterium]|nr:hypothetical protein [Bdellovibrionales bacterium]
MKITLNKMLFLALIMGVTIAFFQNCSPIGKISPKVQATFSQNSEENLDVDLQDYTEAEFAETFQKTLYPVLQNNCSVCHGAFQSPKFAVKDYLEGYRTIAANQLVNLSQPSQSKLAVKIRNGHNAPAPVAEDITAKVEEWVSMLKEIKNPDPQPNPDPDPQPNPDPEPEPDLIPPEVIFTSPSANKTVSGVVELQIMASDNVAVTEVQLYIDSATLGQPYKKGPYTYSWDTKTFANRAYKLKATARDSSGNFGETDILTLTVENPTTTTNPNAKYSWIYNNILKPRCVACHGPSKASHGVRYDSYSATLKTVDTGSSDPDDSQLYSVVKSKGYMPPSPPYLDALEVKAIEDWIRSGAPNN